MTPHSPTWWALWTASIHRPGRCDDEEVPDGAEGLTPWWLHVDTSGGRRWDRERRPDWPTLRHGQEAGGPTPTDWCAAAGRCSGACARWADEGPAGRGGGEG